MMRGVPWNHPLSRIATPMRSRGSRPKGSGSPRALRATARRSSWSFAGSHVREGLPASPSISGQAMWMGGEGNVTSDAARLSSGRMPITSPMTSAKNSSTTPKLVRC